MERAAALKHDLGKYVAWQSANFDDDAWDGPLADGLRDALRSDILATRQHAGQQQPAWDVWSSHVADLPQPLPEPELRTVDAAVEVLRAHAAALEATDGQALAAARPQIRAAQLEIRSALRTLHRRLLRGE